jgi:guanylate kinase
VLAAPSGTGKTTLARALVRRGAGYTFAVSATTRAPRGEERDTVDYHFVDRPAFRAMVEGGELAEWAEVHGELYGTPRSELVRSAERGEHVVLDIDVQGARQIRRTMHEAVLVFVLPPSLEVLEQRLAARGTEDREAVARRLRTAREELAAATEFDYVVVNDDLDRTLEEIWGIVRAELHRTARRTELAEELETLQSAIGRLLERDYSNISG